MTIPFSSGFVDLLSDAIAINVPCNTTPVFSSRTDPRKAVASESVSGSDSFFLQIEGCAEEASASIPCAARILPHSGPYVMDMYYLQIIN